MKQYRCENCKNYRLIRGMDGCMVADHTPTTQERLFISQVGCASHSDFQNDQVLDKLHNWFENYCEGNEDPDLWMAFLHAERAFRKSKDGEL